MDAVLFWDMTYGEVIAAIEGYQRRFKAKLQTQAMFTYKLGELIGIAVNDPKKYPQNTKEAFKQMGIFDEDKEPIKQDWQIMKERMNKYAYLHKKRGET
ncbi:hypothetical protein [Tissierella sp. Yu-01]|uniref:hypothetical protein n=1 Tax=Tissierella sp. Yu-01 TaxID=3035694 RepID=UPI00240DE5A1|nr:hypothetical protein [Tissierella sp. Yu-01]WFA10329.1 hypothetical protein P3962_07195 [Tissierella sp. Yu-01]